MAIHLNFSVFLKRFKRTFVAKVRLQVFFLFKKDVAEIKVAISVEMVELYGILVSLYSIVILLKAAMSYTKEKKYLTKLAT